MSVADFNPVPVPDTDLHSIKDATTENDATQHLSVTATLDSACTAFTISDSLAMRLGGKQHAANITLLNADGTPMSRSPTVLAIAVRRSDKRHRILNIVAHVAPIATDCLVNLQVWAALGIGVTGLGLSPMLAIASETMQNIGPAIDDTDGLISPADMSTLRSATAAAFARNTEIPEDAFMNVPGLEDWIVDVGDSAPVYTAQYPLPVQHSQAVTTQIDKWKATGKLVPAPKDNPWNTSLIVVPKIDPLTGKKSFDKPRITPDLRKVNLAIVTPVTKQRMPLITDHYRRSAGFEVCTLVDISDAYTCRRVHKKSRHIYGITWNNEKLMFAGVPWGDRLIGSDIQEKFATVLYDHRDYCFNYADDIIVFSMALTDHANHVNAVLDTLTTANLRVNVKKIALGRTEFRLLGKIVSSKGISPDPEKVKAIRACPRPTTGKELERYLGMVIWNTAFMLKHADVLEPLHKIKHAKKLPQHWTEQTEVSFQLSKTLLEQYIMVNNPRLDMPFKYASDCSIVGMAAILYQTYDGHDWLVDSFSQRLNSAQEHYSASKLELLAFKSGLRRFHNYLFGRRFIAYTDHKALTYMLTQTHLNRMLVEWYDEIFQYDFEIIHLPGILNVVPDTLSRIYPSTMQLHTQTATPALSEDERKPQVTMSSKRRFEQQHAVSSHRQLNAINVADTSQVPDNFDDDADGKNSTDSDTDDDDVNAPDIQGHTMINAPTASLRKLIRDVMDKTLVTDAVRKKELLDTAHGEGHFGAKTMQQSILEQGFYWPSIFSDTTTTEKQCVPCRRWSQIREGFHPRTTHLIADAPGDHAAMDHAGPLPVVNGCAMILVIIDVMTRYIVLIPTPSTSATDTAKAFTLYISNYGTPKVIQTDNGTAFRNRLMSGLSRIAGYEHRFITPYKPRANGMAERAVRTVKATLRKLTHGFALPWPDLLPVTQFYMNKRVHPATNSSPFALMYGRQPNGFQNYDALLAPRLPHYRLDTDAISATTTDLALARTIGIDAIADRQHLYAVATTTRGKHKGVDRSRVGKKIIHTPYPLDSWVMIVDVSKTQYDKNTPTFCGPYQIKEYQDKPTTYRVVDSTGALLRRAVPAEQVQLIDLPPDHFDKTRFAGSYDVAAILNHVGEGAAVRYLVQWKDNSLPNSWEPIANFDDFEKIADYSNKLHRGLLANREEFDGDSDESSSNDDETDRPASPSVPYTIQKRTHKPTVAAALDQAVRINPTRRGHHT